MTIPRTHTPTRARIEIIPLIDVIFFLLATFVLFTLSLNRLGSIPLTLPKSVEKITITDNAPPVVLAVTAQGDIYWDGVLLTTTQLPGRLALLRETEPDPTILIAGDIHASYGAAVSVLDAVRGAGIDKVSIETRVRPSLQ